MHLSCPTCSAQVSIPPSANRVQCGSCRANCAMVRCPSCGEVTLAVQTRTKLRCGSCGYEVTDYERVDHLGTNLQHAGRGITQIGCLLTLGVLLGVPLLLVIILLIVGLFQR